MSIINDAFFYALSQTVLAPQMVERELEEFVKRGYLTREEAAETLKSLRKGIEAEATRAKGHLDSVASQIKGALQPLAKGEPPKVPGPVQGAAAGAAEAAGAAAQKVQSAAEPLASGAAAGVTALGEALRRWLTLPGRAEVERLQAQVRELEERLRAASGGKPPGGAPAGA